MKHNSTQFVGAGLAGALLLPSLAAQIQTVSMVPNVVRDIPTPINPVEAKRLVVFDADADLVKDFVIVCSTGELILAYAPEHLDSMWPCMTGVNDATRIDATFAPAGATGHDGILVSAASGFEYVHLHPVVQAQDETRSEMTHFPVGVPDGWLGAVKIEAYVRGADQTCRVLALAPDLHTVHIGTWNGSSIVDSGQISTKQITATGNVQQMAFVDFLHNGELHFVTRSNTCLQTWKLDATHVRTDVAPLAHWNGAIATVRNGNTSEVAWVTPTPNYWEICQLRHDGTAIGITARTPIAVPPDVPARFRVVSLNPKPTLGSYVEALLLTQNSSDTDLVLERDSNNVFHTVIGVTGQDKGTNDNCPTLVVDVNRDQVPDIVSALTSTHTLQIQYAAAAAQSPDTIPDTITFQSALISQIPNQPGAMQLMFHLAVAAEITALPNLAVQATVWPQHLGDADGPNPNYLPDPIPSATWNAYILWSSTSTTYNVPVRLKLPATEAWTNARPFYISIRLVRFATAATVGAPPPPLVWASSSVFLGATTDPAPLSDENMPFMWSLLTEPRVQGPTVPNPNPWYQPQLPIHNGSRDVGTAVYRHFPKPPPQVLPLPVPGPAQVVPQ